MNGRLSLTMALFAVGCTNRAPVNRSFPVTVARATGILRYDAKHPRQLRRPLLIVGGFMDPGWAAPRLADRFRRWTGDDRIAAVSLGFDTGWDECRRDVVAAADAAFPTTDPTQTTEVDVVGVSMGGLAARYAALPTRSRRLRIARLFTISSPLRGAIFADAPPIDLHPLQAGLRTGSWLYRRLDADPPSEDGLYAVYSYVRLNDTTVGPANAAVAGATPWWVPTPPGELPHDAAYTDARILADIACRLRGEPPLARDPPAPLPEGR
jgi:pimeloyl-ACP methyl ester carboxylesterase